MRVGFPPGVSGLPSPQNEKKVGGRRASVSGSLVGPPSPTSEESPRKSVRRRASAVSVANVRRASMSGSVAETLKQARIERRRMSQGISESTIPTSEEKDARSPGQESKLKRAMTTPGMLDVSNMAPSEALCGVQVRKPSDKAKAEENEGKKQGPAMPENGKLLQQTSLFGRLSDQALIYLAEHGEERLLRFSEVVYKEGDRQNQEWLGLVLSGQLTHQIQSERLESERDYTLPTICPGMLFGELNALNVTQARHSTVTAEVDSKVLILRSEKIWEAVNGFNDDVQRLTAESECWRAFMASEIASMCHPQIAYQLRGVAMVKMVVEGEEHQLSVSNQKRQTWAAAIIERGHAVVKETGEVLKPKDSVNVAAMLGMNSSHTVMSHGGKSCQIAMLDRVVFWELVRNFPKAKEVYTRWALSQLPSATTEISHIPMLQYLEGSHSFFRALAGSIRQRVAPPRTVAIVSKDVFETLVFLQQGLADVNLHGYKVRELHAGQALGELNLLSVQALAGISVVATEFCVIQELKKADLESHLVRHPAARTRWRELLKVRNVWKQDGAMERQISMMRESPFFGDDLPAEFMRAVQSQMEARIFFPEEKLQKEDDPGDVMFLLCEGQVERLAANGHRALLDVGAMLGEYGLISNFEGPRDNITAKTTCAVMVLHRMNMIDILKRFQEAKPHFEAVTRRMRSGALEEGELWNIYRMSCFKDCSSRFLYLLDLHLERHIFFSDEVVVVENTEGEDMYILYSGTMDVQVKGIKVGTLEGGSFFGEMAVLGLVKKRSATIIAITLSDVRVLSRKSLEEAINEFPQELARFEELAATRNRVSLERRNGGRVRHLCSFFQDCKAEFAAAIADDMQDRLFTAGQVICHEGMDHKSLFLIHQGAATVSCEGKKVSELKSGDICGELVAMDLAPLSTATVTAADTCFMQELPKTKLLEVLERFPQEKKQLRQVAALRMEWKHSVNELQMFQWVSDSSKAMISLVEQLMTRWIFFKGDEIMTQGDPGDSLFMLSLGTVEVLQNSHRICNLGAGDMFGELGALGTSKTRTATVRCKDICDLYVLGKEALQYLLTFHPSAQEALRKLATVRMRSDVERYSEKHILLHCPLFQQSSRKFLDRISEHMEDRLFMEGEDLCKQGEKGDTMFILVQGVLDVLVLKEGSNIKVNELNAGSVIGEIAVLGLANHRTATLRAQKVCLVQVLHRPILMKYLNEFPREIATFQEVGASRLAKSGVSKNTLFQQQVLFRDCSAAFVEEVCKQLQRKIIFPGQAIVEEGIESQEMYAIAQGEAYVEKDGRHMGALLEGCAFGEMAVLGLTTGQSVTIKAERMCDLQYLNSYDLETILEDYPQEKGHMLEVIATMMREELAEISNEELLREIPLLTLIGNGFIRRLANQMQVCVARKEEMIKSKSDKFFIVVLQGKALVQINDVVVRELCEGDSYGEAFSLGLLQSCHWEIKAGGATCLYLLAEKDVIHKVLQGEGRLRDKLKGAVHVASDKARAVIENSQLKAMNFSQGQIDAIYHLCEECFAISDQELLSARQSLKNLLFVLAGKAIQQIGEDTVHYEPGSSMVFLNKGFTPVASAVTATTPCKYLLLNKRVLMQFIKSQHEEERQRLLQCLESMPGQARTPATLRQMSSHVAQRCMQAAKSALKDNVKPWEKAKVRLQLNSSAQREPNHAGWVRQPDSPSSRRSHTTEEPPQIKRSLLKHADQLDQQEALFCKDMRRLTRMAKACAEDALQELKDLRSQADELRWELKMLTIAAAQKGDSPRQAQKRPEPRTPKKLSAR